jgi:hypothetical protein
VLRAADLLELVVPHGAPADLAPRMLDERRAWIARHAATLRAEAARPRIGLERPDTVWLAGRPVPIVPGPGARATAELIDGRLMVAGPVEAREAAILRWHRREARHRIEAAVAQESARLGLDHAGVSIRDGRSRWGSCSARGALSFSWRLAVAPEAVLDYVVTHELCHRRELNHSPRFWRLLDAARPGWRVEARWLRDHGAELHAYRPRCAGGPDGRLRLP